MKIELGDIKTEWLNTKALVLISIFANEASKLENVTINLRSNDVLQQISIVAKSSQHTSLMQLYSNIKREVKMSLYNATKNERFSEAVSELQTSPER